MKPSFAPKADNRLELILTLLWPLLQRGVHLRMVFERSQGRLGRRLLQGAYTQHITFVRPGSTQVIAPPRNAEMPPPAQNSFVFDLPIESLYELSSASGLRRFASNWVRLVLLLTGGSFGWHQSSSGCWRFAHYSKKAYPYSWISSAVARASPPHPLDFDQTLGFPGEGPHQHLTCGALSVGAVVAVGLLGLPALLCFVCFAAEAAGTSKFYPLILIGFSWSHGCLAMQSPLEPRDRQDQTRASGRAAINLGQGRPVLEKTKKGREKLLDGFSQWLDGKGISFADFLNSELTDLDTVNLLLERYGRELFSAGRPYGHYSELVNGIASLRPRFRRSLQGAWDLAYSWLRHEPPCHHVALPWQPLVALLVTSFSWGWVRVAGVVALSWGGFDPNRGGACSISFGLSFTV